MPEVRSVLFCRGADLDVDTRVWVGRVATNFRDYDRAWSRPLLDAKRPVALVLSLPWKAWESRTVELERAWAHENEQLRRLGQDLRTCLGVDIHGPFDLSGMPSERAEEEAKRYIREYDQVIGIAHVEVDDRCWRCGAEVGHGQADEASRRPDELVCPHCKEVLGRYFEVGAGGKLGAEVLQEVALGAKSRFVQDRRLLLLGCETIGGELSLPQSIFRAGLSTLYLATGAPDDYASLLCLATALLVTGFGGMAKDRLPNFYQNYLKLRALQGRLGDEAVQWGTWLVALGVPGIGGVNAYAIAEPCGSVDHGVPHLRLVPNPQLEVEIEARLAELGRDWRSPVLLDVPPVLRQRLACRQRAWRALWVAAGASCRSVCRGSLRDDVKYHVGLVTDASSHVIHRFLHDGYTCVAVPTDDAWCQLRARALPNLERPLQSGEMRSLLSDLIAAAGDRPIVVGVGAYGKSQQGSI